MLELVSYDRSEERGIGTVLDGGMNHATNQPGISLEDHNPIATRSTGKLDRSEQVLGGERLLRGFVGRGGGLTNGHFLGVFAGTFDEDFLYGPNERDIVLFADFVLEIEHFIISPSFHLFRNVIGVEFVGFGSGTWAVLEDKAVLEAAFADEFHAFLESVFGFAAEADDEVTGDSAAWNRFANAVKHLTVVFDGIAPFHSFEDFVAPGLHRNMQITGDFREVADRLEEVVGHVSRIVGNELDSR